MTVRQEVQQDEEEEGGDMLAEDRGGDEVEVGEGEGETAIESSEELALVLGV